MESSGLESSGMESSENGTELRGIRKMEIGTGDKAGRAMREGDLGLESSNGGSSFTA